MIFEILRDNERRRDCLRLNIFWRIALFPIMIIWWLMQVMMFSCIGGVFVIIIGAIGMIVSIGEVNYKEEFIDCVSMILLPIIAPFIWWYKYFKYGEYKSLF